MLAYQAERNNVLVRTNPASRLLPKFHEKVRLSFKRIVEVYRRVEREIGDVEVWYLVSGESEISGSGWCWIRDCLEDCCNSSESEDC